MVGKMDDWGFRADDDDYVDEDSSLIGGHTNRTSRSRKSRSVGELRRVESRIMYISRVGSVTLSRRQRTGYIEEASRLSFTVVDREVRLTAGDETPATGLPLPATVPSA